ASSSVNRRLDHCNKDISCDSGHCRIVCIILDHFQRWECNSTSGCCCHSD
ncbi:hypothetical protein HN51_011094, partial [Arachis hypogaea]